MRYNRVTAFIPTRKGSERVPNKNTKPFATYNGGLLQLKLEQFLDSDEVKDIIVSTNDPSSIEVAQSFENNRIIIDKRPDSLCSSSTPVSELIEYVYQLLKDRTEHILWAHVTAPFVNAAHYDSGVLKYLKSYEEDKSKSLASVSKIQQFLWSQQENKVVNYDVSNGDWPRTQDLEPLYEINHAFYINSIQNYKKYKNRITNNLELFELEGHEKIDIDWPEDYRIAEILKLNEDKL